MFSIIENPFAGWRFYVIDHNGRIIGYSNSAEWCEALISRIR